MKKEKFLVIICVILAFIAGCMFPAFVANNTTNVVEFTVENDDGSITEIEYIYDYDWEFVERVETTKCVDLT